MADFAVLRIAKIKSLRGLSGEASHNSRTATAGTYHADNQAPLMGGGSQLLAGQEDALEAWKARADAVSLAKPRKDAVRALEMVMSASPEWFHQASPDEREQWRDKSLAWATELFGKENILSAHLHDDEQTPHLHVLAIPLAQKPRKKAGRPRKGRKGQARQEVKTWGLSAADLVGTPDKLVELQSQYAAEVAGLGIRRGRPRRATGAQHVSPALYRAQAAESLSEARDIRAQAIDELNIAKTTAGEIIGQADEAAEAFTIGLDAIDQEELTYDPAIKRLAWNKVENPILPTQTRALRRWKSMVKPFFETLVKYARRAADMKKETKRLEQKSIAIHSRERTLSVDAETVSRMLRRTGEPVGELQQIQKRARQKTR